MAHRLRIDVDSANFSVSFDETLESQVDVLLRQVAGLPSRWRATRYDTDTAGLTWVTSGARDQVIAILHGCREHGWPFVAYVRARSNDKSTTWSATYAATYLGWWDDRHAFAVEIATAGAHFVEQDLVAHLDERQVDEICDGFLCLDIDGQVIAFDGLPDQERSQTNRAGLDFD